MKVAAIEAENPGDFNAFGKYMKGANYKASFQESGNTEDSVWSCGLSIVSASSHSSAYSHPFGLAADDLLRNGH